MDLPESNSSVVSSADCSNSCIHTSMPLIHSGKINISFNLATNDIKGMARTKIAIEKKVSFTISEFLLFNSRKTDGL